MQRITLFIFTETQGIVKNVSLWGFFCLIKLFVGHFHYPFLNEVNVFILPFNADFVKFLLSQKSFGTNKTIHLVRTKEMAPYKRSRVGQLGKVKMLRIKSYFSTSGNCLVKGFFLLFFCVCACFKVLEFFYKYFSFLTFLMSTRCCHNALMTNESKDSET